MRVLELHASMRPVKRSEGRSSVQMAAYITRTSMEDERTGETFDHRRKGGVEATGLVAQEDAPEWAFDRRKLWNAVERSAKRKDAQVAREIEIGLPHEFTPEQRREAAVKIAHMLIRRYGGATEYALHEPGERGDHRNFHGHFLFTTSRFNKNGEWEKGRMVEPKDLPEGYSPRLSKTVKDADGRPKELARFIPHSPLDDVKQGPKELEKIRAEIAAIQNDIAVREGHQIFVEHLSFKKRGLDREATQHMGKNAVAIERRGEVTDIGTKNREIVCRNQDRAATREEIKVIQIDLAKERLNQKRGFPAPAMPRTQDEEHQAFYRDTYERQAAMVAEFEGQHGKREKELQREAARLTGSIENAGLVAGLWRRVSGREKADRQSLDQITMQLQDISQRREQQWTAFEQGRQTRLATLKATQEAAEQEQQAEPLPLAVGDVTATPGRVETRAGGLTAEEPTGEYQKRRREYFRQVGKRKQERENEQARTQGKPQSPAPSFENAATEPTPAPANDFEQAATGSDIGKALSDEALKRAQEANPLNLSAEERAIRSQQEQSYAAPALANQNQPASSEASGSSAYEAKKAEYMRQTQRQHEQGREPDRGPTRERE